MNDQTEILDKPTETEAPASSTDITISLDKVKGEIAAFDKINAGLAKLRTQHPADLVVDVSTPAGMKMAVAARAAWRDPRVALERARKSAKAPVLDLGRNIDKFAASIEEQLRVGESNYHDQIKVEEERKAREKKAAEEAEALRVRDIQGRISFRFSTVPMRSNGKTAEELAVLLLSMEEEVIEEALYDEFVQVAIEARQKAYDDLQALRSRALETEAEAARVRTQAEENKRQREELLKQQADFEESQRRQRAELAEVMRANDERLAAERKKRDDDLALIAAEQKKLDDAKRAEADRLAAIERQRLDEIAAQKRADEQIAWEAEQNAREEQRAKEEAERKKAEAAAARKAKKAGKLAAMAPRLLSLLVDLMQQLDQADSPAGGDVKQYEAAKSRARALIAEAEAE